MVDSFCYFYSVALRLVLKFIICAEEPMTLKSVIGQLNGIIRFHNGRKPVRSPRSAGTTGQRRRPPGSGSAPTSAPAGTGQGVSLGRTQGASARVDACCRLGTQRPRRRRKPRGVRACHWGCHLPRAQRSSPGVVNAAGTNVPKQLVGGFLRATSWIVAPGETRRGRAISWLISFIKVKFTKHVQVGGVETEHRASIFSV